MVAAMAKVTAEELWRTLEGLAGRPVGLVLTRNASRYVSFRPDLQPVRVRLHEAFLEAPEEVLGALGRWLAGRERRCPRAVRAFVNMRAAPAAPPRERPIQTQGHSHDLEALLKRVNGEKFGGRVTARITWGRRGLRRAVRARRLGAYYRNRDLIVMNPVLDQAAVPEWFVAFTVYHECLHALQAAGVRPHGREFREALKSHGDYVSALRWEKANLRLLTGRHELPPVKNAAWRTPCVPGEGTGQLRFRW